MIEYGNPNHKSNINGRLSGSNLIAESCVEFHFWNFDFILNFGNPLETLRLYFNLFSARLCSFDIHHFTYAFLVNNKKRYVCISAWAIFFISRTMISTFTRSRFFMLFFIIVRSRVYRKWPKMEFHGCLTIHSRIVLSIPREWESVNQYSVYNEITRINGSEKHLKCFLLCLVSDAVAKIVELVEVSLSEENLIEIRNPIPIIYFSVKMCINNISKIVFW